MRNLKLFIVMVAAAVLHLCCSHSLVTSGGGGSEVEVIGTVYSAPGVPAANAQVKLVTQDYNAALLGLIADSMTTITNEHGLYILNNIAPGLYNVQIAQSSSGKKLLITGVNALADITVPDGTLLSPGRIKVMVPDSARFKSGYIYIPGTDIIAPLSDTGKFVVVDSVFPGSFASVNYALANQFAPRVIRYNVTVESGETVSIENPNWKYTRQLYLNTTAGGANVSDNALNFPVLIRLKSQGFDFGQAQATGADIRFTNANNTPLSYQIERWNPVAGLAEVWVKVDTVRGNDSTQRIAMYWGASISSATGSTPSTAGLVSSGFEGAAVFDTANGFRAVWHLDETANTEIGGYRDASNTGVHATAVAPNQASDTEAIAGKGKRFEPQGGQLSAPMPPGIGGNGSFSMMFWLNFHPAATRIGVLTIGQADTLKGFHFLIKPDTTAQFGPWNDTSKQNKFSLSPYVDKWIHVVTVYDGMAQILKTYINGKQSASTAAWGFNLLPGHGILIGDGSIASYTANLTGALDEIRIYNRVLTENEIRLEYATQKPSATVGGLVVYR